MSDHPTVIGEPWTLQSYYDYVVSYLLNQERQASRPSTYDGRSVCVYRTSTGNRCAVGACIPDDLYDPAMEGCGVLTLDGDPRWRALLEGVAWPAGERGLELASELQSLHDAGHYRQEDAHFIIMGGLSSSGKAQAHWIAEHFGLTPYDFPGEG